MRLRSSQFVFLLLLVCSMQSREEYLPQLLPDTVAGQARQEMQSREAISTVARQSFTAALPIRRSAPETRLNVASARARNRVWSMRRPAFASAAVSRFTSYLRA